VLVSPQLSVVVLMPTTEDGQAEMQTVTNGLLLRKTANNNYNNNNNNNIIIIIIIIFTTEGSVDPDFPRPCAILRKR